MCCHHYYLFYSIIVLKCHENEVPWIVWNDSPHLARKACMCLPVCGCVFVSVCLKAQLITAVSQGSSHPLHFHTPTSSHPTPQSFHLWAADSCSHSNRDNMICVCVKASPLLPVTIPILYNLQVFSGNMLNYHEVRFCVKSFKVIIFV